MSPRFLFAVLLSIPAAAAGTFVPAESLRFDAAPVEIAEDCRTAKARAESALAGIANLPATARTFENTPWALDRVGWELADQTASDTFLKYVSVSSATRFAANECETLLGQFGVETYAREDLYRALKEYDAKRGVLNDEDARLLEKELLDFRRSGLDLPKATRDEVSSIRKKLVDLEAQFGRNLNEVKDYALFTKAQLAGLPEDYVSRLLREGGKYKVTLDYPDYFPFMDNATDPGARRTLEALFNNRGASLNLPLLKEVLALRLKAARLLGYPTHAAFILEQRMAKDPRTVAAFLSRLRGRLQPLAREELVVLASLKRAMEGPSSDGIIHAWDWRFYDNLLKKTKHGLDSQLIREYFPADLVTEQMLGVYQRLLGVKFTPVSGAASWHPDAKLYAVSDPGAKEPFAYFYMDLFPREGKYKHAAAFDLIKGRRLPDGTYRKPVSSIVANFDKPTTNRPSLLTHDEVETFFHEFGHIMHQILTRARHGRFSGSSTARDFVEAPSQMLENWVWDPTVLQSLSGHYKDRDKKLPEDLLERMIAAKLANTGLTNLRQLHFGSVDQLYHGIPPADTTKAYARLMKDIFLIPMSEGVHPEASFGHLMGYDAGYYGYMWSKVFAEDMFSRFKTEGVLNPAAGRRYRAEILERGSAREESDSLRAFLGREPNEEAFLESIGLKASAR